FKRPFGVPEGRAQENFTDPDSRIMKCAGGALEQNYNAQTAVDEQAHIIVAAALSNCGSDAAYKCEAVFKQLAASGYELVVAVDRAGKGSKPIDPQRLPHTAAMAAKLQSQSGKAAYRKRKWIVEPPNGWVNQVLGFRQFSLRGARRVRAEWKLVCLALNLRRMAVMCA
ncbi:MAG: transposase, partial [Hyphomicrobiales bacterium]|nr:transposase [Hyphomicrobiales bacterium]